jgi:peptidoglycan/xylan/chitin deacetylase (PgdA/CDA1 family)
VRVVIRALPWARLPLAACALAAAGAGVAALTGRDVPWWMLGALATLLLSSVAAGVFLLGAGLFARPVLRADQARAGRRVALTFDDGPDPRHTRAILDTLDTRGHRATFFVIGARAEEEPALVAEIVRRGHALGNHSHAHWRTAALRSTRRLTDDFLRAQVVLERAGARGRWFRPPIGILSPQVARAAERARLVLIGWTRSARDGVARTTVAQARARLEPALTPGAILALHDGVERGGREPIAPALLPALLDALDARGLKSVTLDELFGDPPGKV